MFKQAFISLLLFLAIQSPWQSLWAESNDQDVVGKELIRTNCQGCHVPTDNGLSRISQQRKTPEGWEMTISRMMLIHGMKISLRELPVNETAIHEMVKYLSDTQGLAPEETKDFRYLLEQDLNYVEDTIDPEQTAMCGRCHSNARYTLQRRTVKEWQYLVDYHLGQFPSTEYSLFGRDRNWLKIAREKTIPAIANKFPLNTEAWSTWQKLKKSDLSGDWVFSGHMPGKGYFSALMAVTKDKPDYYSLSIEGTYNDGTKLSGSGNAVVYTGYEWRGSLNLGDIKLRQVLAASADGETLTGRFYLKDQERVGMKITALRNSPTTGLLSVFPTHIRPGETATITINGKGLNNNKLSISGATIEEIIEQSNNRIVAKINADTNISSTYARIQVGDQILDKQLAIYAEVSALEIQPAYGVARIGGNGGSTPKMNTLFRAIGIDYGEDGVANTSDDLRLGYIDDVIWEVEPRNEVAKQNKDVQFSGRMDMKAGIFYPANAGPNPTRNSSTNNVGDLNVIARFKQGDREVSGKGRLLVTVQRWNSPPLK